MRPSVLLCPVLLCVALFGCAEGENGESESAKGQEALAPSLGDQKADGSDVVQFLGPLALEGAVSGTFEGAGEFHSYALTLAQGAEVKVEVTQRGTSRGVDSTLYLFGPKDARGSYGKRAIAYDDDSGWGALSRIDRFVAQEAGEYLVVAGTFSGKQAGSYRLMATCENGACAPASQATSCVFGAHYRDLFGGSAAVVVTSTSTEGLSSTPGTLEKAQTFAAITTTYTEATTYEEALRSVDGAVVNRTQVWDASGRRAFVAIEFGAGDNSYGAILPADGTLPVALIQDGELAACQVSWGPERRACATDAQCGAGLRCEGIHNGQGACLDPLAPAPMGEGAMCTTSADCPDTAGLVCAGESKGGGVCNQAWMKRSFLVVNGDQSIPVPDGDPEGVEIKVEVHGLATVSTDEWADLWIFHEDPSQIKATLTNPLGTEVVVFDGSVAPAREIYLKNSVLRGIPGDEDVNGTWILKVVDTVKGKSGSVHEFGLTLTSRWD